MRQLEERGIGSIVLRYRGVDGQAGRYNLLEQERDIQALIETVRRNDGFRRPLALLGYSMGGVHVVRLLANEPRIADAAILLGAAGFVNAQEDELLEQWSHMMRNPQPTEIAHRVKAPT